MGHTGATMSLGGGAAFSSSTKQKLNTRSSTESELVAVDDKMTDLLWCKYFLEWQGFETEMLLLQDNTSAISLEKNGKRSSTKRTKHIRVRFFFIANRHEAGDVRIEHCGTDEMVADFFTKPLQGAKFRKFRKMIMNEE